MLPIDSIRACIHKETVVFLRNGKIYRGVLDALDPRLNLTLWSAIDISSIDESDIIEKIMIKGDQISMIKLDKTVRDKITQNRDAIKENIFKQEGSRDRGASNQQRNGRGGSNQQRGGRGGSNQWRGNGRGGNSNSGGSNSRRGQSHNNKRN